MYIEELILDGFKSYATRTVISGFDKKFNAITGLNGSGKSNILDAICFVLGITNLSQVRASNLQELVYKQGQAGITKASVTIVFNNSDPLSSPVGFEKNSQLTITRQVVIGGRNKYLINGHHAQANQVQNLFHSVQLNVNNPHFLIMQGRITKVLNMKPPEILGMIEEAAGTRMYETKKQIALKTLEKKQTKVDEINHVLSEEITPTLEKLRLEKSEYLKHSAIETEYKRLEKYCIALEYTKQKEVIDFSSTEMQHHQEQLKLVETEIRGFQDEICGYEKKSNELMLEKEKQMEGAYENLKKQEEQVSKSLVKATSQYENTVQIHTKEMQHLEELNVQLQHFNTLVSKTQTKKNQETLQFQTLQHQVDQQTIQLHQVQRKLNALNAGIQAPEDDDDKEDNDKEDNDNDNDKKEDEKKLSLKEKLTCKEKECTEMCTLLQQNKMKMEHIEKQLVCKRKQLKSFESESKQHHEEKTVLQNEIETLKLNLNQVVDHDPEKEKEFVLKKEQLEGELNHLQQLISKLSAQVGARLKFDYVCPDGIHSSQIKGSVAKLIQLKDSKFVTALEITAGGKLYQVVVDTDETGKQLLKHGQLTHRVTLIPLNKITRRCLSSQKIALAKEIAAQEQQTNQPTKMHHQKQQQNHVESALSLIEFDSEIQAAMEYVFGSTLICNSIELAQKVTFHPDLKVKSVTLEGDCFDPAGTLQGGGSGGGGAVGGILTILENLNHAETKYLSKSKELEEIKQLLNEFYVNAMEYKNQEKTIELKSHQLNLLMTRMEQMEFTQLERELVLLVEELQELEKKSQHLQTKIIDSKTSTEHLKTLIATMEATHEKQCEILEQQIDTLKKKLLLSQQNLKTSKKYIDVFQLELDQLEMERQTNQENQQTKQEMIQKMSQDMSQLVVQIEQQKEQFLRIQNELKHKKQSIQQCDQNLQLIQQQLTQFQQNCCQKELEKKKLLHKTNQFIKEQTHAKKHMQNMLEKHPWIQQEAKYFGQPQTDYDFYSNNHNHTNQTNKNTNQTNNHNHTNQTTKRLSELKQELHQTSKTLNKKVMGMIEKAEQEYNNLMSKRHIIENDKSKIESVIKELDMKKKEVLHSTWTKVNQDFGSIFSTLLPGTRAKLHTFQQDNLLAGLQVQVAFGNNKWKESLTELSGGQRSLLALSLILALLLFKPAPMYILDEIDAALDLAHTQNIGQMIKTHFKHSQFIVVSLKEGMFQNANVLFQTKFSDGLSTVHRQLVHKYTK